MPIFARPDGDQSVGNWTATPLWQKIDEPTPSDTDFVQSENDPANDTMEVTLQNLTDPASSSGHIVRYRYQKGESGGGQPGTINVTFSLYQGTTLIAEQTHNGISTGFVAGSFTLTGGEADNITDYNDLRVRVLADMSAGARTSWAEVSWAEFEVPGGSLEQIHFRMRPAGADPAINADAAPDWAFAEDVSGTLACLDEYPLAVRIRFQIKAVIGAATEAYELWYDKDAAASYSIVPNQATPWIVAVTQNEVMLVPSLTFAQAAATTNLLTTGTFIAGEGRHSEPTGSIVLDVGEITEIEFCILIRKWSGEGHVPDASTFDFRLRRADGTVLDAYGVTPRVTIGNKPGHLGGSMPETPANLCATDDAGVMYIVMEAHDGSTGTVKDELIVMMSTDGGDTWTPPDFANRPGATFNDVEAADMQYVAANDRLYIVWQGPESDSVYYVEFNTSGHASPNQYGTVENVDLATAPLLGQGVAFRRRASDGAGFCFYKDGDGTNSRVSYKKRTSGGAWDASPTDLDSEASVGVTTAFCELDASNVIHIIYPIMRASSTDADLFHRSISTGDVLSGRTPVPDGARDLESLQNSHNIPQAPPAIYDDGGTERIGVIFIDTSEELWFTQSPTSSIAFGTDESVSTSVASGGGGSFLVEAQLAWDPVDDEQVAAFIDDVDETLVQWDERVSGSWGIDTTEYDGVNTTGWVLCWVFTHNAGNGSARVLGILYDEHLNPGGTGGLQYIEVERAAGGGINVNATPSTVTVASQVSSPTLAALAVTASPSLLSALASITSPVLSQLDVPATPSSLSASAQSALLALAQLDVQATPAPMTVAAQTVDPIIASGGVDVLATPALLTINAQIATAVLAALAVNATPAPITVDSQPVNPVLAALAVNASPAALSLIAQVVQATLAALAVSATPAPIGIAAQVADPVEGALALNASPAALTVQPQATPPVLGSLDINASPALLAVSAQTVSAVLSALVVQAAPALLTIAAQAADPVIGGVNVNASPAALTAGSQVVDPVQAALAINAASAAMSVLGEVVDPVQAALALNAVPATIALAAQAGQLSLSALNVQLTPVTIAVSGQIVNALLANLIVQASPAVMSVSPQAVNPVFAALAVQAIPSVLIVAAQLVIPPPIPGLATHFRRTTITQQGLKTSVTGPNHIVIIDKGS